MMKAEQHNEILLEFNLPCVSAPTKGTRSVMNLRDPKRILRPAGRMVSSHTTTLSQLTTAGRLKYKEFKKA
jgi:hypothetical protein